MPKVDGGTMHYAIEARAPFLDQKLWDFASALPPEIRFHDGKLKAVLREIARKRIGERVASGRKRGFDIPVYRWIAGQWNAAAQESFRDSELVREGWIRAGAVQSQLKAAADAGSAPHQLWYLIVLESWLKQERCSAASAPELAGKSLP